MTAAAKPHDYENFFLFPVYPMFSSHSLQQEPASEIQDVYFLKFVNYSRHVNIKAFLVWKEVCSHKHRFATNVLQNQPRSQLPETEIIKRAIHNTLHFPSTSLSSCNFVLNNWCSVLAPAEDTHILPTS